MPSQNPFADFDHVLARVLAIATDYIAGLPNRPVGAAVSPQALAEALDEPLSEHGCDPETAIANWIDRAQAGIVASPGPRFFGFVNGGATPAALAGDWLASALDQNAGMWVGSPAAAHTEQTVLRWLKELFSLPMTWAGGMTSGATMANLVGLAAGRQWVGRQLGFDPADDGLGGHPPIRVISSTEIHASARKALAILGLGRNSVSTVEAPGGVIDLPALAQTLAATDAPVIVVANAGEVNTGAFDPLQKIAALCKAHRPGAWLHVDGAFGLFAAVSPRSKHLVEGIEAADSVAADAHKWLNVPYDSGFVFVRDGEILRQAMSATAAYIAPQEGRWDPHSHVPEFSRRFRALPAWCALKSSGRAGYRAIVERCLDNAKILADWVENEPRLERLGSSRFNIVCFCLKDRDDDAIQQAVTDMQAAGRAFTTPTLWQGKAAIRAAFDNWATGPQDVAILIQAIKDHLLDG